MEIIETTFDVKTNTETQVKKEYEQPQEELDKLRIAELKQYLFYSLFVIKKLF